jgi:hypothetical protein
MGQICGVLTVAESIAAVEELCKVAEPDKQVLFPLIVHTMVGLLTRSENVKSEAFMKVLQGAALTGESLDGAFGEVLGESVNISKGHRDCF